MTERELAKKVAERLRSTGLKAGAIAKLCDCSENTVRLWLAGKYLPKLMSTIKLKKAGIDLTDILDDE